MKTPEKRIEDVEAEIINVVSSDNRTQAIKCVAKALLAIASAILDAAKPRKRIPPL